MHACLLQAVNTLACLLLPPCLYPPFWPLRTLAFLRSHLIQFIIVGPPPYTQLSGETKALPNMDAFLFSWICGALPWGFCTPSSPPSPPLHTHRCSIFSPVQEGWKIPGAVHCVTSSMGGNGIQTGWKWMPSQRRVVLLRVIIERKNVATLNA